MCGEQNVQTGNTDMVLQKKRELLAVRNGAIKYEMSNFSMVLY